MMALMVAVHLWIQTVIDRFSDKNDRWPPGTAVVTA